MTQNMAPTQVLNTKGAARRLGCSETWVQKLVSAGKLTAYIYDENGLLTQHQPRHRRQGQGLYFLTSDVDAYQPVVQRRPRGSKNKKPGEPQQKKRTA